MPAPQTAPGCWLLGIATVNICSRAPAWCHLGGLRGWAPARGEQLGEQNKIKPRSGARRLQDSPRGCGGLKLAFGFWVPVQLPPPSLSSSPLVRRWLLSVWGFSSFCAVFCVPSASQHAAKKQHRPQAANARGQFAGTGAGTGAGAGAGGSLALAGAGGALVLSPGFAAGFGAQQSPGGSGAVPPGRTRAGCSQVSHGELSPVLLCFFHRQSPRSRSSTCTGDSGS